MLMTLFTLCPWTMALSGGFTDAHLLELCSQLLSSLNVAVTDEVLATCYAIIQKGGHPSTLFAPPPSSFKSTTSVPAPAAPASATVAAATASASLAQLRKTLADGANAAHVARPSAAVTAVQQGAATAEDSFAVLMARTSALQQKLMTPVTTTVGPGSSSSAGADALANLQRLQAQLAKP
jgi:hypothetical protein